MITPMFQMNQEVYYKMVDSEKGIILDICYYYKSKSFHYLVGLDYMTRIWVSEDELTEDKIII